MIVINKVVNAQYGEYNEWEIYIHDMEIEDIENLKKLCADLKIYRYTITGVLNCISGNISNTATAWLAVSKEQCKELVVDILKDERYNNLF